MTSNSANYQPASKNTWSLAALAENPPDQPNLPLYGLAHRVALYGYAALESIPHAHFGVMLSVDRQEMETLRGISQLVRKYRDQPKPKEPKPEPPLCIAAFGPPGAGKSFGIKEIVKEILGDKVPILEFNLSQFEAVSGLHGAFHQVRDQALKGVTPVVFWDEFDSQGYNWLQYLLAPMQDGVFEENGHTHTIGKCVFVFAGATSWDFAHFGPAAEPAEDDKVAQDALNDRYKPDSTLEKAEEEARNDFRRKKGPDFLSRLDAHIDVLGPNQRLLYNWKTREWNIPDPSDITFPVRRALLLRQFLGAKKGQDRLLICRNLLHAFLHVPKYRFSARSLEKVAKPAAAQLPPLRRAHLPPPQVLHQHLETLAEFDRIYQKTHLLLVPQTVDALANAINEGYNCDNPSPWNKAFKNLDAFTQQSNRAAAIRIPHILALAGLCLTPRKPNQTRVDLNDPISVEKALSLPISPEEQPVLDHLDKHLEVLAEEEHRLWSQFHEANGWTFGYREETKPDPHDPTKTITTFEKDKAKLLHPCMKPFHEMPDEHGQRKIWQDYDRKAIRRYPRILRLTDLEITFARQ